MNPKQTLQWFTRLIADGRWIAVFENQDPESPQCGMRIATPCKNDRFDDVEIGMASPEAGNSWSSRWFLVAKARTAQEAMQAFRPEKRETG